MLPLVAPPNAEACPAGNREGLRLVSLTLQPRADEPVPAFCRRVAATVLDQGATPLHLLALGDCRAASPVLASLKKLLGRSDWPVTWVAGAGPGRPIAGLQVHAFTGPVERITLGGRVVASVFTDGGARQCLAGGLMARDLTLSRGGQTARVLEDLREILASAGFELTDAVRTWFYLEDILSWYDEFNRARTGIYAGLKFRTGSLPASTGVGARNPRGSALALAAWAFRPAAGNSYAEEVASPLQCPAPAYGSSFSRALEISTNGGRRLFVSGTASIAPGGQTLWVGDVSRQIDVSMAVVEAILRSRGFGWRDLARATAYFRRPADAPVFSAWLAERGLGNLPVVCAQCDVCRDDLLFELEGDAERRGA